MAIDMPEFEMPVVAAPPRPIALAEPAAAESAVEAPPPTPAAARPPLVGWRKPLVIALVAGMTGALGAVALSSIDDGAARGETDALQAVAAAYLGAIAAGDSIRATDMVPPESGVVAPQAMLESARRIRDPEVLGSRVDGDRGVVEVRFRAPYVHVTSSLEASFDDGAWRLTTSLAEVPIFRRSVPGTAVSIAGIEIGRDAGYRFYPGTYALDVVRTSLSVSAGSTFTVDGNHRTFSDVVVTAQLRPEVAREAVERATAQVRACQLAGSCPIAPDAELDVVDAPIALELDRATGAVELAARVWARSPLESTWLEIVLQVEPDTGSGEPRWRCLPVGVFQGDPEPCAP